MRAEDFWWMWCLALVVGFGACLGSFINVIVYRQRFEIASQEPYAHMDLGTPQLGFVEMAQGMGVAATRIEKADDIGPALEAAFSARRPHLVEIAIEAKR